MMMIQAIALLEYLVPKHLHQYADCSIRVYLLYISLLYFPFLSLSH